MKITESIQIKAVQQLEMQVGEVLKKIKDVVYKRMCKEQNEVKQLDLAAGRTVENSWSSTYTHSAACVGALDDLVALAEQVIKHKFSDGFIKRWELQLFGGKLEDLFDTQVRYAGKGVYINREQAVNTSVVNARTLVILEGDKIVYTYTLPPITITNSSVTPSVLEDEEDDDDEGLI